jgi:multidrug efflux pump subunit AcrA (membrane-fusion protein)
VVVPYREIDLSAEVAGRVVYKAENARIGRTVEPGDVLVRIDPRDYQSEVDRLQEDVRQAENNLVELEVQIESAQGQVSLAEDNIALQQRFLDREERLQQRNATTEVNVDTARRDVLSARTTFQTKRDELRLLRASQQRLESARDRLQNQLAQARLELERTEITAPIQGMVIEEMVESDGYLQKGGGIVRLRDISRYDVQCSLRVEQMKWLWETRDSVAPAELANAYNFPATPVDVVYHTSAGEYIWSGLLSRYDGGGFDPQTRMIPCRVDVDDPTEQVVEVLRRFDLKPDEAKAVAAFARAIKAANRSRT